MAEEPRTVIVTGGGAGIGKAAALRFAAQGYAVIVADRAVDDGQAVRDIIRNNGGRAEFIETDVAREADCLAMADVALTSFGRIDALVANAGARVHGSILDATDADWQAIISINLRGVSDSCKAVLPTMIQHQAGAIVIISSANALVGRADMPLYDATKAAVLSLTRSLAVAHGRDGVRVNAVCPGYTMTDFHERKAATRGESPEDLRKRNEGYGLLGRAAEPSEMAAAIWFLGSDEAAMITGQTLLVDAGMSVVSAAR